MVEQRVDQRAVLRARRRMRGHARRLDHHDQRRVLVQNRQRDRLSRRLGWFRSRRRQRDRQPGRDLRRRVAQWAAADLRDAARFDQRPQPRAAQPQTRIQRRGQRPIETRAGRLRPEMHGLDARRRLTLRARAHHIEKLSLFTRRLF
ncbi:MAG: hypothetical protein AAGM38_18230 [Pseudomonadota bacterium]